MSLLLVGVEEALGDALIPRLVDQSDEVRVLENDPALQERWRSLGAYIARGDESDPDLLMRAATNCRTVVAGGPAASGARLSAAVEGALLARVERIVLCAPEVPRDSVTLVRRAGIQFVALSSGKRGIWRKKRADPRHLAIAVDAADDLAGEPALELDLCAPEGWAALGLGVPS